MSESMSQAAGNRSGTGPDNRLDARFRSLAAEGRTALIPFITAGDPDPELTVPLMHALVTAGADVIEMGMPFSDPMADGPVIQAASERALARGMTLGRTLEQLATFRRGDKDTPVLLMGYLNPIERMGYDIFVRRAAEAGADAILLVDCPPEESDVLQRDLQQAGLHQIFLIAPTTREHRRRQIIDRASGFVYYVALKGVTGAAQADPQALGRALDPIREGCDLPLAVGFGIKTADDAVNLGRHAEGVVIGSALIEALSGEDDPVAAASDFLKPIRRALDGEWNDHHNARSSV